MTDNRNHIQIDGNGSHANSVEPLAFEAQEYTRWERLFARQPGLTRRFMESQAQALAEALVLNQAQIEFRLPGEVASEVAAENETGAALTLRLPKDERDQVVGGLVDRLSHHRLSILLRQRLDELEADANPAVALAAGLTRFAAAMYLVTGMLPEGRTVMYRALEGEEIASMPAEDVGAVESAITAETDAIVEGDGGEAETGRGSLQTPFVPWARRFYLPQWVAFDENDHLLAGSLGEAEAHIASMQRFLRGLHTAVGLAAYLVADPTYRRKRYGMLGQLVNQGRALARYQTGEIIATIQRRAAQGSLNRGLSLSLPYFDDQDLEAKIYDFQVIPAGRIMFVPAFVVRACRQEEVKIAQDTRLSPSTRRHLLGLIRMLELEFAAPAEL